MTDIRKSDAQLDAEAAQPLEERDLDVAIAAHRVAYQLDAGILRLHQRDGESGIGPPFAPGFVAFLDEHGGVFSWSKAAYWQRNAVCRRTHSEHWEREEWNGSLCGSLLQLVIRMNYSLDQARLALGLANESKTQRTLDNALLAIERRLEDYRQREQHRAELRPRTPSEWMGPAHEHRTLGGLHASECPTMP